MEKILLKDAVSHIFRASFFKLILLTFVFITASLFLVQNEIVFPIFEKMQIASVESEAARTANHLKNLMQLDDEVMIKSIPDHVVKELQEIMKDFSLVKIKIFDPAGVVVFSSDLKDMGNINTHGYFHNLVAKGQLYTMIVNENQASLEGEIIPVSVAEVYVPIMSSDLFLGAFEIYYDITEQFKKITKNELFFNITSFSTWFFLTLIFISLLIKASKANILKAQAEKKLTQTNRSLEATVEEKTREIKATQIVSIQALAVLAEHYDPDTGEHLERIQLYVKTLLEHLASTSNRYADYVQKRRSYVEEIVFASLLHDIGKTAIPVELLIKPVKLTTEEFEIIKSHTTIAGEALDKANTIFRREFGKDSYLALARDIAIYHHERWNGEGYPHQLKGEEIPLSARITAIADVYDALTSERPYKKAWSHEEAFKEIVNCSESHFDPELVEAFIQCSEQFKHIAATPLTQDQLRVKPSAAKLLRD